MMAKILLVNLTGQMAGAEQSLFLLARYLGNHFRLTVACPKPSPLADRLEMLGITTLKLPAYPEYKLLSINGLYYFIRILLVLLKLILTHRPDLVHANTFAALGRVALPARLVGKPIIAHARDFHR